MKKILLVFFLLVPMLSTMSGAGDDCSPDYENICKIVDAYEDEQYNKIQEEKRRIEYERNIHRIKKKGLDNYTHYSETLAKRESNCDYYVVNRFNFMGKYQFGTVTLKEMKKKGFLDATYSELKRENFLNDFELQERAMMALTEHNLQVLKNYKLMKYVGKKKGGVKVTVEGMLAAAHLRGPFAVKEFIKSNGKVNRTDGNGTSVKDYMKLYI